MGRGAITEQLDVASLLFILFTLFFVALIAYLHRESKREGYPLVNAGHQPVSGGVFGMPPVKTYRLADGTSLSAPHDRDAAKPMIPAAQTNLAASDPLVPFSATNTLGIGPGSYANRRDVADVNWEGKPRIQPMRRLSHFSIAAGDLDLKGCTVVGADGVAAGQVKDVWVDISETTIRYLEVGVGAESVLLPINLADIDKDTRTIAVPAILGAQFADVPRTAKPDVVTLLEEERLFGYYGAGYLYATPRRQEPLL